MTKFNGTLKPTTNSVLTRYDGANWTARTDLGAGQVGYFDSSRHKQGSGMRFLNITIPSGSAILTAVLEVEAGATETLTTVNSYITGEKSATPAGFTDLANYQTRRGTVVGGANDDNLTSAQVSWDDVEGFTLGVNYQSPDISTVIQEIIDLPAWADGNNLAIFWDDHDGRSTASNTRSRRFDWGVGGYYALIITWGPKFPSSDVVRVTGIRRIYRPGIYRMQLSLGEISDMDDIARHGDYGPDPFDPKTWLDPLLWDIPLKEADRIKRERDREDEDGRRSPILPPDEPTMPPPFSIPRTGRGAVPFAGDDPERQPLWKPKQKLPFPAPPPSFTPKTILEAPKIFWKSFTSFISSLFGDE